MKKRQLVGIINCTPDSYFEGGRFTDPGAAIAYGLRIVEEGADVLDIGGESTRPGSDLAVSVEEEIRRVIPVIKGIRSQTDIPISIDTFKPEVAKAALGAGATLINDITGLSDPMMQKLARDSKVRCVVMHMYSTPHVVPANPIYPKGVVEEICDFFKRRVDQLLQAGLEPAQIILDPGIGGGAFGKSVDQDLTIIKNVRRFTALGFPVLIGLSRKSFLQKFLQKPPSELLSTTLALNTMALQEGATYIRVHDIAAHRDILSVLERMETLYPNNLKNWIWADAKTPGIDRS